MSVKIQEIRCKQIIVKSKLPKAPYVVNPYTGCQYGCVYCYSDFMRRWTGHSGDKWGEFVDVKINCLDLLEPDKNGNKNILFSSVTDPYQPIESKLKLTRKLLKKLSEDLIQPEIEILTKSSLVKRDIDILKRFKSCSVGFSFSTLDDDIRKTLEPFTPTISKKIEALKKVHMAGITTYVFISPIMPYLTDVKQIITVLKTYVNYFMFENLNVRNSYWNKIKAALRDINPDLILEYENIYFKKGGKRKFWDPIEKEIKEICHKEKVEYQMYFHI